MLASTRAALQRADATNAVLRLRVAEVRLRGAEANASALRALKGYRARERRVVIRSREPEREVHGRLIARRLPEAAAEKAGAWVRRELGSKASPSDLEAAHYVVLFTTARASAVGWTLARRD